MKIKSVFFTAATILFITACNNSTETNTTSNTDTSARNGDTAASQNSTSDNSANSGADLMKPMNDMMSKMELMQMTGDFDVDFAKMMIEHHQGAIDMAQIEVPNGKDETMKTKAQEILTKQKDEQQKLRDFVSNYKPSGMKHGEGELQKHMSEMKSMMQSMKMNGDTDKDFATHMRHHHEHGIAMAKMELKHGMSSELKKMAQKSIDDHQKDVKDLDAWLSSHK